MSLKKPLLTENVTTLKKQLNSFMAGSIWLADGEYFNTQIVDLFAYQYEKDNELQANFIKLSELAGVPGSIVSKIPIYKSMNFSHPGVRHNVLNLYLVGMSNERKLYLESLSRDYKTIILESQNKRDLLVFTGLKWYADFTLENAGFNQIVLKTEWYGETKQKVIILKDIQAYGFGDVPWGELWGGREII